MFKLFVCSFLMMLLREFVTGASINNLDKEIIEKIQIVIESEKCTERTVPQAFSNCEMYKSVCQVQKALESLHDCGHEMNTLLRLLSNNQSCTIKSDSKVGLHEFLALARRCIQKSVFG